MLEARVKQLAKDAREDHSLIDIAVEAMQRWIEYLDELELCNLPINSEVTVKTEGKTIKFPSIDEVSEWTTSNK